MPGLPSESEKRAPARRQGYKRNARLKGRRYDGKVKGNVARLEARRYTGTVQESLTAQLAIPRTGHGMPCPYAKGNDPRRRMRSSWLPAKRRPEGVPYEGYVKATSRR